MATGLGVLGAALVGGGTVGVLRESARYGTCTSGSGSLGHATFTHQCGVEVAIFFAGYGALIVGLLLMIAAVGLGLRHQRSRRQTGSASPGWYPDPTGVPVVRWWDGHHWSPWFHDRPRPAPWQPTISHRR